MHLLMVRHGESTANVKHLHAGWAEVPLTEKGKKDAENARILIKEISFDKVYSSDLLRARQTAKIVLPDQNPILTDLIREIDVGQLSGKSIDECKEIYGNRYFEDKAKRDFRFYGGENHQMHMYRVENFLKMIAFDNADNIIAFSHEGTIRIMLKLAGDYKADTRVLENGGVYRFEYTNDKLIFADEGV